MSRPGASGAPTYPGLPAVTPTDREGLKVRPHTIDDTSRKNGINSTQKG